MKPSAVIKLFIACGLCLSVGLMASLFTTRQTISNWYAALDKPFFTPPDWVFGPTWTVLYLLMGISAFLIWRRGINNRTVRICLALFIGQLVLNGLWTPLFFGLQMPLVAFVEILLLWSAILLTIMRFKRVSKTAALLLIPYILWVSFAAVLNGGIWLLNR